MSLKGRGFKLKWHGSYISLNNDIHRGRSSDISRFKVLHKTSISSFKFNFRSGSAWSSARRFIRPWVQGHGGLNTLLLNADSSTLVTASLSILLLWWFNDIQWGQVEFSIILTILAGSPVSSALLFCSLRSLGWPWNFKNQLGPPTYLFTSIFGYFMHTLSWNRLFY